MRKLWIVFLLIVSVGAPSTDGQTIEAELQEIEDYAVHAQVDWKVPGMAIGIVKDDALIYAKGFGERQLGRPETVDQDTLFAVASNSKAFTVAALAILVDEGKLQWDDPVRKYLPEFVVYDPYVTSELTVRDLVSHRSGLATFSGDLLWYETNYSADEILRRTRYLKPTSSFRSRFGYQNLMYIAAGKVIERVSGKTWAEFVDERILTPLGMERTTTSVRDFGENIASPHNESASEGNPRLRALSHGNVDNCWGACGINSSVGEMSRWLRLQLGRGIFEGKQIFSKDQSWEMWQPNVWLPISESAAELNPTRHFMGYGMGWVLYDYQGVKVVNHSGGLDGMISQSAFVPERNFGLVVLTNSESPLATILRDKILDVMLDVQPRRDWNAEAKERRAKADQAKAEADAKVDAAHVADTKPTLELDKYVGTYSSEMYGDVTISLEDGRLVLRMLPAANFVADLEHWHFDTFRIRWRETVHYNFPRGFVTFKIDGQGIPDELVIDQPNDDFWFYELELKRK